MAEPKQTRVDLKLGDTPTTEVPLPLNFWTSLGHSNIDTIRKWIDNTNPFQVRRAGQYYCAAETLLNDFAADVKRAATALAEQNKGTVAVETQKQLRSLHASVRELATKFGKVGRPLQDYAATLEWAQQNVVLGRYRDSRSDNDIDWADVTPFYGIYRAEKRAMNHLKKVNARIVEHYAALPEDVQQALPNPDDIGLPPFEPTGFDPDKLPGLTAGNQNGKLPGFDAPGDLPSGPNGSIPNLDGTTGQGLDPGDLGYGGPDTDGLSPSVVGDSGADLSGVGGNGGTVPGLPGTGTGTGATQLAGYNGSGTLTPPGTSLTGPAGYGTSGMGSSGPGGVGSGSSGIVPAYGGMSGSGTASTRTGARGTGTGRLGANGMMMGPARGGEGREEQEDRENTTWLMEDDEVWGDSGGTIPPVLG